MSESETINILVFGLGAVGGLYAYILSQSPQVQISVVARSNYNALTERGLKLDSKQYGEQILRPHAVYRSLEEAKGRFDYIVFSHKALPSSSLPTGLSALVTPNTTVVLLQNGVGIEQPYWKGLPGTTILTCSLWMSAHQHTPGVVTHIASVKTPIGLYHPSSATSPPSQASQFSLSAFSNLLIAGGMPAPIYLPPDMQVQKWEKLIWNATFNSLTALAGLNTHTWLGSSVWAEGVTTRLMREIMSVAAAEGVFVREDLDEFLVTQVKQLPAITSSMAIDIQESRMLEVDVIFGVVVEKAAKNRVPVPTLEVVSSLLMGINSRLSVLKAASS